MLISVAQFQLYFLAFTRIMALIINVPVLGGQNIPNQIRIGLGLLLTALLIPWQPLPASAPAMDLFPLLFAILREVIIGSLAGFAAVLTFNVFQIAGEMMGQGSGFNAGRILNPAIGSTGSAYDQLFVMLAMLLFLVLNGHHEFLMAVQQTFKVIPLNTSLPDLSGDRLMLLTAQLIMAGVQMSLPVLGTLLLTDIALGLVSRVAPQVQVFFLGLPVKIGLGLFAMGLLFTVVVPVISDLVHAIGPRALYLLGK